MARVMITGAVGFVGRALCPALRVEGWNVLPVTRAQSSLADAIAIGDMADYLDWQGLLPGVDAIVHLAARVHVMRESVADPVTAFRRANVDATLALAHAAVKAGVKRFVFVSSVKVHGEGAAGAYRESDRPQPADAYAVSKLEAEAGLQAIAAASSMELVVLRPPLIYGSGVAANFARLAEWVSRGVPLPFGSIENRRSLLYVGNLVSAISACLRQPEAAGKTFLVADEEAVSTPELVRRMARAMGTAARLVNVPPGLLLTAARIVGKQQAAQRLLGSLTVDDAAIRHALGWHAPVGLDEGLRLTFAESR